MANSIPNNIQLLQYADDILLIGTSNHIGWLCDQINIVLESLSDWLDQHSLPIAASKSGPIFLEEVNLVHYIPM